MYLAIGVDPTKLTAAMPGCSRMRSTATLSPCTTLNTPSGRPAALSSSARNNDADGSFSDGFSTNVLPQAMALANIHIGTMAGKLNGVMPATTPSGWRIEYTSTPFDACSLKPPFNRFGMPQANSTFSRPRATSPRASPSTLPCSDVRWVAISLRLASTSSRKWNITSERRDSDVARHAGKAVAAAATAASTSSTDANSTSACWSPVAGFQTGPVRPDVPATVPPLIQCEMRFTRGSPQTRYWVRLRRRYRPWPLVPTNEPPSTTTAPRESTVSTRPAISMPSHAEWSMFMWAVAWLMVWREPGSYTTMSASLPGATMPLRGNRPNMRAGVVQHVSTQRVRLMSPVTTP